MAKQELTIRELQEANVARCTAARPLGFGHALHSWSSLEWAGAMCGEAGEAANVAKKLIRMRDGVAGNDPNTTALALRDKLANEYADVVIYAMLGLAALGQDAEEVIIRVFNVKSRQLGSTHLL